MKMRSQREASQRERFDRLIRPYVVPMFQTAYRLTGDRHEAEDLVQDVLVKLYPQTSKVENVADLKPWLARAIHNRYVDIVRKRVRSPAFPKNHVQVDSVIWFERRGEEWIPWSVESNHPRHTGVTIIDLNQDGRLDIVGPINYTSERRERKDEPAMEVWFNLGPP